MTISAQHAVIILVEPSEAGNVGATARAMANMGFSTLRLVNSKAHTSPDARTFASGADEQLDRAETFEDLADAVADCHVTIGCTARTGKDRSPIFTPEDLVDELAEYPSKTRLALVFGRENYGLSNEELDLCHFLVTIPTSAMHPSLNLAQAVLLMCYELARSDAVSELRNYPEPQDRLATSEEIEALYQHLAELLQLIEFHPPDKQLQTMKAVRRAVGRLRLRSREVHKIRGVFRQLLWYARQDGDDS